MKNLTNHVLFYDENCPLCAKYTELFVRFNFLDKNGRAPFSNVYEYQAQDLDLNKAKDKIALLDITTGRVTYGLDSLLKILNPNFRFIRFLTGIKPLRWFFERLYLFVSLNRKVIVPSVKCSSGGTCDCVPSFNLKYRALYILLATVFSGVALTFFTDLLGGYINQTPPYFEFMAAFGQILFLGIFVLSKPKILRWNYLGNLATVSLIGSLMLVPILIVNIFMTMTPLTALLAFNSVFILMFLMHYRRVKALGLGIGLCLLWLVFRLTLLIFVL